MSHDVFISYSHIDKHIADAICSHFESNGLRCWYAPRDIRPGADWAESIIKAIEETRIMVLVFTDHSNISQQVLREVNNAVSSGVTIVPFKLTEEEPVAGMKYYLSTVHWLDAMNSELSAAIGELYELCRVLNDQLSGRPVQTDSFRPAAAVSAPAVQKKKTPVWIYAVAGIAAVGVIGGLLFMNRGSGGSAAEPVNNEPASTISANVSMDMTETYTQGNTQGNLQNGGFLTTDGEWFYYRSNDRNRLYRMKGDGSEAEKLTDDSAGCISVVDGYVYYISSGVDPSIRRISKEGGTSTVLHYGMCEDMLIVNERIYYKDSLDGLHLHSMALDGSDVRLENTLEDIYYFCLDGTYIYYNNQEDGGYLYRADMDGSNAVCLLDHQIENMTIAGNLLYFNDLETNKLSSYDLAAGEVNELADDYIAYLNVTDSGIYGYSGTYSTYLCSLQHNGLGFRILKEVPVRHVCVCGSLIFYENGDDKQYYIVNADGSGEYIP